MKLLSFKRLIGLAAIGGVAYIHKQRGGPWTLAGIADTLKHLWSSASGKRVSTHVETKDPLYRAGTPTRTAARDTASDDDRRSYDDQTGRH